MRRIAHSRDAGLRTRDARPPAPEPGGARIVGVNRTAVIARAKRGRTNFWRFATADIAAFVERSCIRPTNGAVDREPADE